MTAAATMKKWNYIGCPSPVQGEWGSSLPLSVSVCIMAPLCNFLPLPVQGPGRESGPEQLGKEKEMRTLFLDPPAYDNFDGGARCRSPDPHPGWPVWKPTC